MSRPAGAVASATGWLRARIRGRAMILGYHRVGTPGWDPAGLAVRPDRFEEHLRRIRRFGRIVPLATILAGTRGGALPRRSVALTFDDGYRDNLTVLLPLLERYEAHATVFVTTGYAGGAFWWDELAAILDPAHPLPRTLELRTLPDAPPWPSGAATAGTDGAGERRHFHGLLADRLARLPRAARADVLDELRVWAGVDAEVDDDRRPLLPAELTRLASSPWVELGAHSVTHPRLGELAGAEAAAEVEGSLAAVRGSRGGGGASAVGFSYPHGSTSPAVRSALARAGASYACCSEAKLVEHRSDPFLLPRYWPGDFEGDRFSRWLNARWLGL
jgi:peptidoglycan/xylan/chitin deacetylase (PgdA/CDA1 family)